MKIVFCRKHQLLLVFVLFGLVAGGLTSCVALRKARIIAARSARAEKKATTVSRAAREAELEAARETNKHLLVQPAYILQQPTPTPLKITQVIWQTTDQALAVVETLDSAYQIYVDCKTGLSSQNIPALLPSEQVSLVRDICNRELK